MAAASVWGATGARAQSVLFDGAVDANYENAANYQGGVAPTGDGTDTLQLPSGGGNLTFNSLADILGLVFLDPGNAQWNLNAGLNSPTLTIGAGGIGPQDSEGIIIAFIDVPVVLAADQTWNGSSAGFVFLGDGVSGNHAITVENRVYFDGDNSFTGGLTVSSNGSAYFGTGDAAGTGTLTLLGGANISSYSNAVTLPNPVSVADGVTMSSDKPLNTLTLAGVVTFTDPEPFLQVGASSSLAFSNTVTGVAGSTLTISGEGPQLPTEGGSQLVMTGPLTQFQALSIDDAQVILAPTGDPVAALSSLTSPVPLSVINGSYLGLGGSFANSGAVANFLSTYGTSLGSAIQGTLGLDNVGNGGVFSDPIDLSQFNSPEFLGLGSATSVTVTGVITPVNDSTYFFGGGGGTLKVTSSLVDFDGTDLVMTAAPGPLTVILQGPANNFEGGTTSEGGVLIFDSPFPGGGNSLRFESVDSTLSYVGYTELATNITTPADFFALYNSSSRGVIGFDSTNPAAPRTISDPLDLSGFDTDSEVFLGTATVVTLSGPITPPQTNQLAFTGVKGGFLTVASDLTGSGVALTVGLPQPLESNGSVSTVELTSASNTFDGGTTFNSGILYLAHDHALGTGTILVPDGGVITVAPRLSAAPGTNVTLANDIGVGNLQSAPGLLLGDPATSAMLTLNGGIFDIDSETNRGAIGILGSVTLGGDSSYQNGTTFMGLGAPNLTVTSSDAIGTGTLTIETAGTLSAGGGDITLNNPIQIDRNLTLGFSGNLNTLTLAGPLTGAGDLLIDSPAVFPNANAGFGGEVIITGTMVVIANEEALGTGPLQTSNATVAFDIPNPTLDNLSGDSSSVIELNPGATLTLFTPNALETFSGVIGGDPTSTVVKTGTGTEMLSGISTFGGGTTISQGAVIAGNTVSLGLGPITVNGGAQLATTSGVILVNSLTLNPGAVVGGTGAFAPLGGVLISGGTAVSPGNPALASAGTPVGALAFDTGLTFGPAGIYNFNIATAGGAAGIDYSTLSVTGIFDVTATAGSPFVINIGSIDPGTGLAGPAAFNPLQSYSWTLLSADAVLGFNASKFTFMTSGFTGGLSGNLALTQSGNTLVLDFTPVPEPSTWALLLGGVAIVTWGMARRRRA